MKKLLVFSLSAILMFSVPISTVYATSLDDIISESGGVEGQTGEQPGGQTGEQTGGQAGGQAGGQTGGQTGGEATIPQPAPTPSGVVDTSYNDRYIDSIKNATKLSEPAPGAEKINEGIKKVASFIVQVLSYFVTAALVVRVLLDICYITIPFSRSLLSNGFAGTSQPAGGMGGMGGMNGMGGMSGGGFGMGGGGFGMNRGGYGMQGGMGGMGGMNQSAPGANTSLGRMQFVSGPALNAVARESEMTNDGRQNNALKMYAKDMVWILVATPVFLLLAITGTLTDLGFLIGGLLADAIASIGSMI